MRISAAPHRQPAGVSAQATVVREIQIAQATASAAIRIARRQRFFKFNCC
jgi:hypothetical protein